MADTETVDDNGVVRKQMDVKDAFLTKPNRVADALNVFMPKPPKKEDKSSTEEKPTEADKETKPTSEEKPQEKETKPAGEEKPKDEEKKPPKNPFRDQLKELDKDGRNADASNIAEIASLRADIKKLTEIVAASQNKTTSEVTADAAEEFTYEMPDIEDGEEMDDYEKRVKKDRSAKMADFIKKKLAKEAVKSKTEEKPESEQKSEDEAAVKAEIETLYSHFGENPEELDDILEDKWLTKEMLPYLNSTVDPAAITKQIGEDKKLRRRLNRLTDMRKLRLEIMAAEHDFVYGGGESPKNESDKKAPPKNEDNDGGIPDTKPTSEKDESDKGTSVEKMVVEMGRRGSLGPGKRFVKMG